MRKASAWIIFLVLTAIVAGFSITSSGVENESILIAYFDRAENSVTDTDTTTSASKVSDATPAAMAQMIWEQTGADVFSITVSDKYPSDYNECLERAQQENSANARPVLSASVQNMEQYDTVFLGFPDWCGTCPMAVFTFLESYDFSGKTIIPFCAHGTSGFGTSISDIKSICPNAEFAQEFGVSRDSGESCENDLQRWLENLGYGSEPEMVLTNDSVVIKATEPIENESLILAGYSDGRLMNINIRTVSTDSNLEINETVSGFEGADTIKAFLWDGTNSFYLLCTSQDIQIGSEDENLKTLTVYFTLAGNANYNSDVDATTSASVVSNHNGVLTGTTEAVADMIHTAAGGDIAEIRTVLPYPADFDAVVDQNHDEIDEGTLPQLQPIDIDISEYDTVFIGYPVWATTIPQAIRAFINNYDLSGKTVIPFCTHNGYGSGNSYDEIEEECPQSMVLDGLTVPADDIVGKDLTAVNDMVVEWLAELGINNDSQTEQTPIKITVGGEVLDGYLNNTTEAQQFKAMLPITISMVGYGGREYYGGISYRIEDSTEGRLNFDNGDITYCPSNNTVAIFYAQTERPDLTMQVIPMGRVTSDLTVFDNLGARESITFEVAE